MRSKNLLLLSGNYRLFGLWMAVLAVVLFASCSKAPAPAPVAPAAPPPKGKSALIIVDMQNDFCRGGAAPVEDADSIIPIINQLQEKFDLVVATQDWHPENHSSFKSNNPDAKWPVHCVQDTPGAELAKGLNTDRIARVFQRGKNPEVDGYSGFFDGDFFTATGLGNYLRAEGVTEVSVVGLAMDDCVKNTAVDAISEQFTTTLIRDATRGRNPEDSEEAVAVLTRAGAKIVESGEVQ